MEHLKIERIKFHEDSFEVDTSEVTYIIKYKDMGDISKGWIDSVHSLVLSAVMNPKLKSQDFKSNPYDSNESNINQRFNDSMDE